ncbi:esterase-like activity of phytase family protein [Hyphobacterium sp. HN65]|uniref:Esterase-like activity of phytase family protein n=1 Tax=Hyphobacterium lacteum TaxID=3116575 RepID=A0ABU7LQ76_9PROT|nr:esterase-like activity of phytase family protein [Hyphobacterium sp. HN65]MEE2526050.1 esterase-like activity of phytase family protein [Hyphobacterium sp. HN65]
MRALILVAVLAVAACSGADEPGPIRIETESVPLYPETPERTDVGGLEYRGGLVLTSADERFGGLSAMEIEGERMLAISDSAYWLTAHLEFDGNGWLTGLSQTFYAPMLGPDGQHLTGDAADAEGLAPLGNGAYAVSFEREHRISRYDIAPDWSGVAIAMPTPLPAPPGTDRLRENGGIESLAPVEGGYWAGIEYPIVEGRPHSIWHMQNGEEPEVVDHDAAEGFGITGLATSEFGLLVLERFYSRDIGNRIRITSHPDPVGSNPDHVTLSAYSTGWNVLAELEPGMTIDNFEGISIGEVNGERRLFILSDDNYNPGQRTLLLSFALPGLLTEEYSE